MTETTCVLCQVYYPRSELHAPDRSQTCEVGRRRLDRDLFSVHSMYLRLVEIETEIADDRTDDDGRPLDPIAAVLPMAPTPGASKSPSVSGSRERQLPINVSVVDLTSPARPGAVSDPYGDQTGHLSVATVLYEWVHHWKAEMFPGRSATASTAEALLDWIRKRFDSIVDAEPGIAAFAEELGELKSRLRAALGETRPKPVVMYGVSCRRCDTVSSLVLDLEDPDRYRECQHCGLLMTEVEYKEWLIEVVEKMREGQDLQEEAQV